MKVRVVLIGLLVVAVGAVLAAAIRSVLADMDPRRPGDGPSVVLARDGANTRPPSPRDWTTVVDLAGPWAFRIGDRPRFATAPLDAGWDRIAVPAAWEDEGYHGYDGFGWYRTAFDLDAKAADLLRQSPAFLLLGRIDDTDEVWINGTLVGWSGRMPPGYQTSAFSFRTYRIPPGVLRTDAPNELAVRVYDAGLEGGILEGPVALVTPSPSNPAGVPFVADLAGDWRFSPGDGAWADPDLDVSRWDTLRVPATWESQGYRTLGGTAWYRKTVDLSAEAAGQDLVLVLGAIDDLDETFVNGVGVGSTGDVATGQIRGDEWQIERGYPVPGTVLREGENVIAVRVIDGPVDGGIYRGPVALMTPEAAAERQRRAARDDR